MKQPSAIPGQWRVNCTMGRHRRKRFLSFALLAVFALRALPGSHVQASHHCAAPDHSDHAMAGMESPQPNSAALPVVSEQPPADSGCSHCLPAECEVTSPCATNTAAGLPAETAQTALHSSRSAVSLTTAHGATSAAPDLLTPPPRSLV
jgi:hypothetical protein